VIASACLVAGDYGLIEYLARSSATLRIAAERLGRYHRLMNDRADAQLSTRGALRAGEVRLRYVGPATLAMPRPYVEYVIGAWVRLAREATDQPCVVVAVHLPFPAPRDRGPYRDALGATIAFGRPHADVILDAKILDRPLVGADTQVTAMLERHAEAVLAAHAPAADWRRRVSEALRPRLADGAPRLATIAANLGQTERMLRRRLEAEGTTFAAILDELRQSLALQMVDDPALSVGEIAFVLGFSEASAFHRAFRRWTGRTPRPPLVARARRRT
jgi:AraC-like DNA-binding protein